MLTSGGSHTGGQGLNFGWAGVEFWVNRGYYAQKSRFWSISPHLKFPVKDLSFEPYYKRLKSGTCIKITGLKETMTPTIENKRIY